MIDCGYIDHPMSFTLMELLVSFGSLAYLFVKKGLSFGRRFINKVC